MTTITLPPDLEGVLAEEARRRGTTPELLAAELLRAQLPATTNGAREAKQPHKPGIMAKLKDVKIEAPADFAANLDLYMSGEKRVDENLH
jgi:hypothetical protein